MTPPHPGPRPELLQAGYRYAVTLSRDPVAAKDLLQDACLAVLKAGRPFDKPYFFAALRTRHIDRTRKTRLVPVDPDDVAQVADPAPDLDEVYADREALREAMDTLRDEEREVVYLHAVERYTCAEIAELTGRSRNTVMSWLRRGREKLKAALRAADPMEVAS